MRNNEILIDKTLYPTIHVFSFIVIYLNFFTERMRNNDLSHKKFVEERQKFKQDSEVPKLG